MVTVYSAAVLVADASSTLYNGNLYADERRDGI
jgi:hypothetical protein